MPELLCERTGVQRPRAAERDEREVGRIVPALDGDDAQGAQHLGVHDLDHVGRVDAGERLLRRSAVELEPACERSPAAGRAGGWRR